MTAFFLACVLQAPPPPPTAPPPRVVAAPLPEPKFDYMLNAYVYPPDEDGYQWIVPLGRRPAWSVRVPSSYNRIFPPTYENRIFRP